MQKTLSILFLFVTLIISAWAFANSMEYLVDDQILTGTFANAKNIYADLHFNHNNNDFGGKIFFQDLKVISTIQLEILGGAQKDCSKQLRGFYINSARGNKVRPLDQESLAHLQSMNSSYDNLSITGGFFVCNGSTNSIVGYIQHTWSGEIYSLIAGLGYDFPNNNYLPYFQTGGNFLFVNGTSSGYLWDSYGGIARINGSGLIIGSVCGNSIVESGETCDEGVTNGQVGHCNLTCNGTVAPAPSGGGGGGGGGSYTPKDSCPGGRDCSASLYDGLCGICLATGSIPIRIPSTGIIIQKPPILPGDITNSSFNYELNQAYLWAYSYGITTMNTIQKAKMEDPLIRKHAAKMISVFAINILGLIPNSSMSCNFNDMYNETLEMRYYAKLSCQLGLMGIKPDGTPNTYFSPNEKATRAQFGTMLSRALYGDKYNIETGSRYYAHLKALNIAGIMKIIYNPMMLELRGYVMIMMKRAAEKYR